MCYSEWLIPAPCEPYLPLSMSPQHSHTSLNMDQVGFKDCRTMNCYYQFLQEADGTNHLRPWRFPSLVSLPLYPQTNTKNILHVPSVRNLRSPSLPSMRIRNSSFRIKSNSKSMIGKPSIFLTKASIENGSSSNFSQSLVSFGSASSRYINQDQTSSSPNIVRKQPKLHVSASSMSFLGSTSNIKYERGTKEKLRLTSSFNNLESFSSSRRARTDRYIEKRKLAKDVVEYWTSFSNRRTFL